jgi:hypothetical protein
VGARAANADAVGTVLYDLDVPDFAKQPFSMSGLVLSSNFSALTPTGRADQELQQILKTPPTTARDFPVLDTLYAFVEVYDNQTQPHQVDITTTLRADDGRVVFKTEEQRSTDELQGARGGFGYVAQVPLRDVAPGQYVLRVQAQSRLSGSTPVDREALVRIWPAPQRPEATAAPAKVVVNVARGPQSQVEAFKTTLARNEEEWQALWTSLPMRRPAPRVTFASTMIAAVFLGSRPSAGYGVEIVGVKRDGDAFVIEYAENTPQEGVASADVVTTPYAIAGVPMYTGDVRFEKVEKPRP